MDVVSLGMLTIDEIVFSESNRESNDFHDLLGGAGTFAVLGARILAGPTHSRSIGWVVHEGHDFPPNAKVEINSWNLHTRYIHTPERRTTRARNRYEGEERFFNFETPKMQVTPDMLDDDQLQAKTFHIISTPARCVSLVETILELRNARVGASTPREHSRRPLFVWEPMEHSCSPQQMPGFETAMKLVDVFSPNELEFAKLVGIDLPDNGNVSAQSLRQHSFHFLDSWKLQAVVVRLGGAGVYVASTDPVVHDMCIPAYYDSKQEGSSEHVVDVTGGGNAFLGAYCYALANDHGVLDRYVSLGLNHQEIAAVFGSVAASFVIEQFGMPELGGLHGAVEETWGKTKESVSMRMHYLLEQLQIRGNHLEGMKYS